MQARSSARWLALGAAILVAGARVALATPVAGLAPPTIDINGKALDPSALHCEPRGGVVACEGSNLQGDGYALDGWAFLLNPDPSVTGTFNLTNLAATTQTFILTVTLPVAPVGPSLVATGSIGAGTLTDLNANGATLTDDGTAIYSALIDGSSVRTLMDPPQSFTAPANPFGSPSSVTIPGESFGPELLAQAVSSSISIRVQYTLTAGDQVAFPISFAVQPIPEPGTLALVAGGVATLAGARRRRASALPSST